MECHVLSCGGRIPFIAPGCSPFRQPAPFSSPRPPSRGPSMAPEAAAAGEERDRPPKLPPGPRLGPGSEAGATVWGHALRSHRKQMSESGMARMPGGCAPVRRPPPLRRRRPSAICHEMSCSLCPRPISCCSFRHAAIVPGWRPLMCCMSILRSVSFPSPRRRLAGVTGSLFRAYRLCARARVSRRRGSRA